MRPAEFIRATMGGPASTSKTRLRAGILCEAETEIPEKLPHLVPSEVLHGNASCGA
jgi:hypothetical protein